MRGILHLYTLFTIAIGIALCPLVAVAQVHSDGPPVPSYLIPNYDDTGRPLPPGVPRAVDTNGNVVFVPHQFTTKLYRDAALKLVLNEANEVARELSLKENLPITVSNLVEYHIGPFGFNYAYRSIGTVVTSNYAYCVSLENKFSYLEDTHQMQDCQGYEASFTLPDSQIDTNSAYQLAKQWLATANMDVAGLERDCRASTTIDTAYVQASQGKIVPIYWITWIPKDGSSPCAADVRLCLPAKALLQLRVEDPKYILRKPLVFQNLPALFPGVATIRTNYPVKTVQMSAPSP